jgi:hypothetical protein
MTYSFNFNLKLFIKYILVVLFSLMMVKLLTFHTSKVIIINPIHKMSADSVHAF